GLHVPVIIDAGGVLNQVLGDSQPDLVALELRTVDRREALPGAEHAGGHGDPHRLAGLVGHVDLADLADLAALAVDRGPADELLRVLHGGHKNKCSFANWYGACAAWATQSSRQQSMPHRI